MSTGHLPDYYNAYVASDPTTSPDILTKILKENRDDGVSYLAAYNSRIYTLHIPASASYAPFS